MWDLEGEASQAALEDSKPFIDGTKESNKVELSQLRKRLSWWHHRVNLGLTTPAELAAASTNLVGQELISSTTLIDHGPVEKVELVQPSQESWIHQFGLAHAE